MFSLKCRHFVWTQYSGVGSHYIVYRVNPSLILLVTPSTSSNWAFLFGFFFPTRVFWESRVTLLFNSKLYVFSCVTAFLRTELDSVTPARIQFARHTNDLAYLNSYLSHSGPYFPNSDHFLMTALFSLVSFNSLCHL